MREETYGCKNCGYTTDNKESINRYVYSHSKDGEFKLHPLCPICGHGMRDVSANVVIV